MIHKSICLWLGVIIAISCIFSGSTFAVSDAKTVNSHGVTKIEAESYSATTINVAMHGSSQLAYVSTNPTYPNNGCIAFVGIQSATYRLNVGKSGKYRLNVFTASGKNRTFAAIENGVLLAKGEVAPSATGAGMANFIEPGEIGDITLSEGVHNLEVKCTSNNDNVFFYYLSLESLGDSTVDFSKKTGSYRESYIPTVIQAEDFDLGVGGSLSIDGKNSGGAYRKDDGIDIYALGAKGYSIVLSEGEYVRYTFMVERSGIYALSVAAGTTSTIQTYFDFKPAPIETNLYGSDDYPETIVANIYLNEGQHNIKVTSRSKSVAKLDYIRFVSSEGSYISLDSLNEIKEPIATVEKTDKIIKPENPVYKTIYIAESGNDNNTGAIDSPFATIKRAKEEIAKINNGMNGDIIVYIQPGTYKLNSTELFGVEHSGKNGYNVIFRGANIFNPPVLSGGKEITGWEKDTDVIWKAPVDGVKFVRNLYVNGYPATCARSKYLYTFADFYKKEGSANVQDGITVSNKNFPETLSNLSDIDLVWNTWWVKHITPVEDIIWEEDHVNMVMRQPTFDVASKPTLTAVSPGTMFYIENAKELLDEPGEFYYNLAEKVVYYYPYKAEDLATAKTYIGDTELLFKISGESVDNKIENLVFDNLKIQYGAYNLASEVGYVGGQADSSAKLSDDGRSGYAAQFAVDYAENISIQNCEFSCLGSAGISMIEAVSNSRINGNIIRDISGTGIRIGTPDHEKKKEGMEVCQNIEVTNNVLHRVAGEFFNNTAISVYYEKNINICHNDILDVPYTGITAGWGWEGSMPYDCSGINISYNRIENVMATLIDGGGIYTLGQLKNSTISNNYLKKSSYIAGMIYTDAGSSYIDVFKNITLEAPYYLQVQDVKYNTHDLKFHDNYSDTKLYYDPGKLDSITIEPVNLLKKGAWPQEALEIAESAGLEAPYKRLLTLAIMPKWHGVRAISVPKNNYKNKDSKRLGITEAEDFMEGGEGIGYHKILKPMAYNNKYRSDEVILEKHKDRSTYVIAVNQTGEWLKYDIDIGKDGNYFIDIEGKQFWAENSVAKIYLDDELLTDNVPMPNKKEWTITTMGPFNIKEGTHVIKFEFISSFYFDKFRIYSENRDAGIEPVPKNDSEFDEGVIVYEAEETKEPYFIDIAGHWAEETILEMAKSGIISGVSSDVFAPNDLVTRSQATLLALRALKLNFNEQNWQEGALAYGVIETTDINDEFITREEFVDIIMKAYVAKYKKYKVTFGMSPFLDMESIDNKYINVVLGAYEMSLIKGDDKGNFNPKANMTRSEAAVVVKRLKK